jgi:hypothetical protein
MEVLKRERERVLENEGNGRVKAYIDRVKKIQWLRLSRRS